MTIPAQAPDLIIRAGNLHTMRPEGPLLTESGGSGTPTDTSASDSSIAVTGGVITAIGTSAEVEAVADSDTEIIDLDGTIVPAFTDAHAHPVMSLSMARGADLTSARDLDEDVQKLIDEAERTDAAGGEWVLGWGLDPNHFPDGIISNEFLHEALGAERRVYVSMFDAHSAVASAEALRRAGIEGAMRWDSGSRIVADADGRPTGHILEFEAMSKVQEVLPAQPLEERADALHALLGSMAAEGIGDVHVMDMNDPQIVELLDAAEKRAPLPVKMRISPWCTPWMNDEEFLEMQSLLDQRGERWRVEGVKFFIDGTVEGGTAWLETPDTKGENVVSAWGGIDEYAARVRALDENGVPTATHAIGERGIREVAETLAALPENGVTHRIEHIESVPKTVLDLIGRAGIAASMQPTHCTHYTRADGSDEWSIRLGEVRAARAWCIRDAIDAGAVVALGSDYPVAPYPVLPIMADAQLRRPVEDPSVAPVLPEQTITAAEALAGYTTGPQSAIGATGGFIAVGQPASFAVLDVDPLTVDPQTLGSGRVLLTVSDGIITHRLR